MSVTLIPGSLPYPYKSYPGMAVAILVFFHGKSMKAAIKIIFSVIGGEDNTMKFRPIATIALIILALALVVTGCEPKKPAPQTTETTAAEQPAAGAPGGAQGQAAAPAGQAQGGQQAQAPGGFDKKIYFAYDSVELTPESTQALDSLAGFLKDNPGLKVQVAGNCDERGTTEYNLALGDRRAKAARDYLVSKGVDEARVSTISYGEEKPADPGHTEEAWEKNRRDEFLFSK